MQTEPEIFPALSFINSNLFRFLYLFSSEIGVFLFRYLIYSLLITNKN